jgi:hypothetical protein
MLQLGMRSLLILPLCFLAGACSVLSDLPPPEVGPQPDDLEVNVAIGKRLSEYHLAPPVETTDVFRAPPNSLAPWMVCIRSGSSDEARRLMISIFFGRNYTQEKDGQYLSSRYSTIAENCHPQAYHPYVAIAVPSPSLSPSPSPGPTSEPQKHRKHQQ